MKISKLYLLVIIVTIAVSSCKKDNPATRSPNSSSIDSVTGIMTADIDGVADTFYNVKAAYSFGTNSSFVTDSSYSINITSYLHNNNSLAIYMDALRYITLGTHTNYEWLYSNNYSGVTNLEFLYNDASINHSYYSPTSLINDTSTESTGTNTVVISSFTNSGITGTFNGKIDIGYPLYPGYPSTSHLTEQQYYDSIAALPQLSHYITNGRFNIPVDTTIIHF